MLQPAGDSFIIDHSLFGFMHFTFETCVVFTFDGSISVDDSQRLAICLFNKTQNQPVG